jgi:hypothetical protein
VLLSDKTRSKGVTAETAGKVAQVIMKQRERDGVFDVNFADLQTCRFMADAFQQLGCQAEIVDENWCLVRVTLPEKASA